MNSATLHALAAFPEQLELFYEAIPEAYRRWEPESWEGIPSETFSPIGQVCHVRDIEIDGYHQRFQRPLRERLIHILCSHDQQHLAGLQWLLGKIEALRAGA